jgi:hypothetical protein
MEERFMKRVDRPIDVNECWEWIGGKTPNGYGMFSIGKKSIHAHRFAYIHWKGEITPGLWVLHTCGKKCVNPAHLELGTAKKNNLADKIRDGTLLTGIRNPSAKYTEDQIRDIRIRYASGETQTSIAASLGIKQGHISDICLRKAWKDLE